MLRKNLPISERIFRGKKIDLLVLGREEITNFTFEKPYLIISITDPKNADAQIVQPSNLIDIIRLRFDDIGKPNKFQFENSTDILMNSEQAMQILEFIEKNLSQVELIVCQCEQGMSRSAGIGAALSRILQDEDEYFLKNYWANRWVYDLLIETAKEFNLSQ